MRWCVPGLYIHVVLTYQAVKSTQPNNSVVPLFQLADGVYVCLVGRGRNPTYSGWRAAHWRREQMFSWEFCFLTPGEQQIFHPSPSCLPPVTQEKTEVTSWRVLLSQANPAGGCLLLVNATWTCAGEEQDPFFILDICHTVFPQLRHSPVGGEE